MVVINGERMGQTLAILRYLGITLGFYPCDDAELAWNCDSIMDTWTDCLNAMGAAAFAPEDKKQEACAKFA